MVQKGIEGYWAVIDKHTHYKITDQDVRKHNLQSGDTIQIEPSCNPGFARILQRASKGVMKIKLSKKQWEEMGKTAGWKKTAAIFNNKFTVEIHGVDEDDRSNPLAVNIVNDNGKVLFISQNTNPQVISDIILKIVQTYLKENSF